MWVFFTYLLVYHLKDITHFKLYYYNFTLNCTKTSGNDKFSQCNTYSYIIVYVIVSICWMSITPVCFITRECSPAGRAFHLLTSTGYWQSCPCDNAQLIPATKLPPLQGISSYKSRLQISTINMKAYYLNSKKIVLVLRHR